MSEQSEPRVPCIQIELELEGRVGFALVGVESADVPRIIEWISADPLRRLVVAGAFTLGQPNRERDVDASDETLAAIAEAIGPLSAEAALAVPERVPAEQATPPSLKRALDAVAPMGSYQGWTLRRIVGVGERSREWLCWALGRDWPLDPEFAAALRVVCEAEGLQLATPDESSSDEDSSIHSSEASAEGDASENSEAGDPKPPSDPPSKEPLSQDYEVPVPEPEPPAPAATPETPDISEDEAGAS